MNRNCERLAQASLLAGAIGDSLGAEIEFWSLDEIQRRFPKGLPGLISHRGLLGAITDDTQMTLFTAEGLIAASLQSRSGTDGTLEQHVYNALLRWLSTQGASAPFAILETRGIVTDPRLHHCRAPGATCLASLRVATPIGAAAHNHSKGCGTIMRVAPVAFGVDAERIRDVAIATSALTHGHPTAQFAAAAWAELLHAVFHGEDLDVAAIEIERQYRNLDGALETANAIRAALEAPRDRSPETVERLGGGWVAEEALSIALYSALATSSLEDGLLCAVTHGGDSDSTGAIAGNLLGLIYPDDAFDHPWSAQIECRDLILRLGSDLISARTNADDWPIEKFEFYPKD